MGTNHETKVDGRVIAATNRKLEKEIQKGNFPEDLYYQLNVVNIRDSSPAGALPENAAFVPALSDEIRSFVRKSRHSPASGTGATVCVLSLNWKYPRTRECDQALRSSAGLRLNPGRIEKSNGTQ